MFACPRQARHALRIEHGFATPAATKKTRLKKAVSLRPMKKAALSGKTVLTSVYLAEEALALPPEERATLARLLLESVTEDARSDAEIREDLQTRLARLRSGEDAGLNFEMVFGEPA